MSEKGKGYYKNKLNYIRKYNALTYKTYCFRVNKDNESDIIAFLDSQENKQGYIKSLIRDDIKK